MKKPERIESRIVYHEPYHTIRLDRLKMKDHRIHDYYVIEHKDAVAVVPITEDGDIILVEQYRHPIGCNVLDIPGGLIDIGESPSEAIKRELTEETGYRASEVEYLCRFNPDPSISAQEIKLYQANGLVKVGKAQPENVSQLIVHKLRPKTIRNILLSKSKKEYRIKSSWSFIGLLLYFNSV